MPTYVYESIPAQPGEAVQRFEFTQRMFDAPFTAHPSTGQRIRRVITPGAGFLFGAKPSGPSTPRVTRGCGCGTGCGCGG